MSTKINVRSPYYIDVQEPTRPVVELTCTLIALQGFGVDGFGNVVLPNPAYGDILSYSSTDSDFSDGKFDTVLTDTSRTVTFSPAYFQQYAIGISSQNLQNGDRHTITNKTLKHTC